MSTEPTDLPTFSFPAGWKDWSQPDLIGLKEKVDEHTRKLKSIRAEWSQKMSLPWGMVLREHIQKSGRNSQAVQSAIGRAKSDMKGRNVLSDKNLQDSDRFPDRRKAVFCMEVVRSLKERDRELYEDIKAEILDDFDATTGEDDA